MFEIPSQTFFLRPAIFSFTGGVIHHHGFAKPQRRWSAPNNVVAAKHNREHVSKYPPPQSSSRISRYPRPRNHRKRTLIRFQTCISCTPCAAAAAAAAALHPPSIRQWLQSSSSSSSSSPQQQQQQLAAAAAAAAAAARSMSYKSDAPKYRWVGAQDHSLLAGVGISSGGSNYLVVHSDQVSGRWLCQRCC